MIKVSIFIRNFAVDISNTYEILCIHLSICIYGYGPIYVTNLSFQTQVKFYVYIYVFIYVHVYGHIYLYMSARRFSNSAHITLLLYRVARCFVAFTA